MQGAASGPKSESGPDWRLRAALLAALAALVITASVVKPGRTDAHRFEVASPAPTGTPSVLTTAPAAVTPVPGAVTGAVTRPQAGGGCGFSLAGSAEAPVGHCTVLEIGDSLGNDIGWGMAREVPTASGVDLVQLDKSASGLANSTFYDWPAQLQAYLDRYRPQVVLVSLGGDDEQGMEVNGSALQFPTPAWKNAYLSRVRQLVAEGTASGAYVLWVGMPVMRQDYYSQGIQILNALDQQGVTDEANATFVSSWSLFANPRGAFQSGAVVNGAWASLRQSDGIHYSFTGENVIATYLIREMAQIYHVGLAPTSPAVITAW